MMRRFRHPTTEADRLVGRTIIQDPDQQPSRASCDTLVVEHKKKPGPKPGQKGSKRGRK